jgi:hypothetical protein
MMKDKKTIWIQALLAPLLMSMLLFASCGNGGNDDEGPPKPWQPPVPKNPIIKMGMNVSGLSYYGSPALVFTDAFRSTAPARRANQWQYTGDLPGSALRPDGYPLEVTSSSPVDFLINPLYMGDYVLLYDGTGTISIANVTVTATAPGRIAVTFREASYDHRNIRISSSLATDPIRNIRLIPKEYEGKEETMPLFRKDFTDSLWGMNAIRLMDLSRTNGSTLSEWGNRPKIADISFEYGGIPLEYQIDLCNAIGADGWFNVPHAATDDFIRNMAALIKSRLNNNLKCYIEYSNEVWSFGGVGGPAVEWLEDNTPAVTDIEEKIAWRMMNVFKIFGSVFTGADRSRLVTTGAVFTVSFGWSDMDTKKINYWKNNGGVPDAIAMSAYFNYTQDDHDRWIANTPTIDQIMDAIDAGWNKYANEMKLAAKTIKDAGAKVVVYEGGQHMQPWGQGRWSYNNILYEAQISSRMYDTYMKNFQLFADVGCDLFMHFSHITVRKVQWGSWGALEKTSDIYRSDLKKVAPKYMALIDANIARK